jgi:hypothetical protein
MAGAVRVEGLRELQRSFNKIDRALVKELGTELKKVAEPVASTARQRVTRFTGASVSTIRTTRSGLTVYVTQGARKVTGRRGDFGSLQYREVLTPALLEHQDEIKQGVDRFLGKIAGEAGF